MTPSAYSSEINRGPRYRRETLAASWRESDIDRVTGGRRSLLPVLAILAALFVGILSGAIPSAGAQTYPPADGPAYATPSDKPVVLFGALTREERRDLLARMSDAEVRQLLLDQLDQATATIGSSNSIVPDDQRLRQTLAQVFSAGPDLASDFGNAYREIRGGNDQIFLGYRVLAFLGLILFGLAVEGIFRRLVRRAWRRREKAVPQALLPKFGVLVLRIVLEFVGVALFFVAAYGVYLIVELGHEPGRIAAIAYLKAVALIRIIAIFARLALAPYASPIRLFDMKSPDARAIYWWVMIAASVLVIGFTTRGVVEAFGMELPAYWLLGLIIGGASVALLLVAVWRGRRAIAVLIQGAATRNSFRGFLAFIWPVLVSAYLILILVAATIQGALSGQSMFAAGIASLIVLVALPIVDAGLCRGLAEYFGRRDRDAPAEDEVTLPNYEPVIRTALRTIVIVVAIIVLLSVWGINVFSMAGESIESRVIGGLITAGITILVAYVVWQVVRVAIDRKLILEGGTHPSAAAADATGDGGGSTPMSRIYTLLPLLRAFLLALICVVAAMTALSALGVNIGPLIAGAGIVGLAIGFGAQTLVRDIVSGLFFLWDDAFRVGEYVDLGFVAGTVESISIRSMRLRHHRGPVHTVPYGEIKHLTNHSRDWVIMKLEFRVPYEADISKIKKIFKTIGQDLQNDPEIGPNLLQPLKSQGVLKMEDSAMIIRAKFMSKPGEQFVIRREVFSRVQRAFKEAGIEFAHRRVLVDVPREMPEQDAAALRERAAAAAFSDEPAETPQR